jgi:hypothetical protein
MRRLLALVAAIGGALLLFRRREATRERISLYYDDGSMVTLERGAPGSERVLELARAAL